MAHICRVVGPGADTAAAEHPETRVPAAQDDFTPLTFSPAPRRAASSPAFGGADPAPGPAPGPSPGGGAPGPGALASFPDLRALMSEGDVQHEVTLSWRAVVDALVRHADGSVTVLELTTGPRDAAARQLRLHVEAVERLVPGTVVRGRIVHFDA
jgi:hypothetical protein